MQIDDGNNYLIKLQPYKTPIKNRHKTINNTLDADVIRRSTLPWSFPIVLLSVDKNEGNKKFSVDLKRSMKYF